MQRRKSNYSSGVFKKHQNQTYSISCRLFLHDIILLTYIHLLITILFCLPFIRLKPKNKFLTSKRLPDAMVRRTRVKSRAQFLCSIHYKPLLGQTRFSAIQVSFDFNLKFQNRVSLIIRSARAKIQLENSSYWNSKVHNPSLLLCSRYSSAYNSSIKPLATFLFHVLLHTQTSNNSKLILFIGFGC